MRKIISPLIIIIGSFFVIYLVVIGIDIRREFRQSINSRCHYNQVDLNRNSLPSYTHFFSFPKQEKSNYPLIYEYNGFSDFNAYVYFEVSPKWIEKFIKKNNLLPTESRISNLLRLIEDGEIKNFPDIQNPGKWSSFSGSIRFTHREHSFDSDFYLYVNEIETIAILNFYSIIRSDRKRGLSIPGTSI